MSPRLPHKEAALKPWQKLPIGEALTEEISIGETVPNGGGRVPSAIDELC